VADIISEQVAGIRRNPQEPAHGLLALLWASLLEINALRARDPGIRMAAQDLYEAAAALVLDKRAGALVADIRRWRLLKEAHLRLRRRLDDGA
jgi:hypothetical protein